MVECDLAKVEVAGSNPVSRSRILEPSLLAGVFMRGAEGAAAKLSRFAGVSAAGARRRNPERSEGSFHDLQEGAVAKW